jgi:hypothetical protein
MTDKRGIHLHRLPWKKLGISEEEYDRQQRNLDPNYRSRRDNDPHHRTERDKHPERRFGEDDPYYRDTNDPNTGAAGN